MASAGLVQAREQPVDREQLVSLAQTQIRFAAAGLYGAASTAGGG